MLALGRVRRRDGGRTDKDADTVRFAGRNDAADRIKIDAFVRRVGARAPTNVIDTVRDEQDRGPLGEDIALEPFQSARGCVAAPAGIDEPDPAARESEQRIALDDLAIGSRRRDAVAEKNDGIAVAELEIRASQTGRNRQQR